MPYLFDMADVAYLEAFDYNRLKREKWKAELELHASKFWFNETDAAYWTEYLEAVNCAINRKRYDDRKRYPANNNSRVSAADIKSRHDIVNVIEQTAKLRKSGNRLTGSCPLHDDKHPSMIVYPDQQSWWCYQCNKGGDVFDFIQEYDNLSFSESLNKLAGMRI